MKANITEFDYLTFGPAQWVSGWWVKLTLLSKLQPHDHRSLLWKVATCKYNTFWAIINPNFCNFPIPWLSQGSEEKLIGYRLSFIIYTKNASNLNYVYRGRSWRMDKDAGRTSPLAEDNMGGYTCNNWSLIYACLNNWASSRETLSLRPGHGQIHLLN